MTWTKQRIVTIRWESDAGDFCITQTAEHADRPYRLESARLLDDEPILFATLRAAQNHGGRLEELTRLRAEAELRTAAPAAVAELPPTPGQRAAATRRSRRLAPVSPAVVAEHAAEIAAPAGPELVATRPLDQPS